MRSGEIDKAAAPKPGETDTAADAETANGPAFGEAGTKPEPETEAEALRIECPRSNAGRGTRGGEDFACVAADADALNEEAVGVAAEDSEAAAA